MGHDGADGWCLHDKAWRSVASRSSLVLLDALGRQHADADGGLLNHGLVVGRWRGRALVLRFEPGPRERPVPDHVVHGPRQVIAKALRQRLARGLDPDVGQRPVGEVVAVRHPVAPREHPATALAPDENAAGLRRNHLRIRVAASCEVMPWC